MRLLRNIYFTLSLKKTCWINLSGWNSRQLSAGRQQADSSSFPAKRAQIIHQKTPQGKLDSMALKNNPDAEGSRHRDAETNPLQQWPDGINPQTGESGGPAGPEPTRFNDWERKGRVSDF